MIVELKAGDELEYTVLKVELGPGSYSFEPFTLKVAEPRSFEVPRKATYIRLNNDVLRNETLNQFRQRSTNEIK